MQRRQGRRGGMSYGCELSEFDVDEGEVLGYVLHAFGAASPVAVMEVESFTLQYEGADTILYILSGGKLDSMDRSQSTRVCVIFFSPLMIVITMNSLGLENSLAQARQSFGTMSVDCCSSPAVQKSCASRCLSHACERQSSP